MKKENNQLIKNRDLHNAISLTNSDINLVKKALEDGANIEARGSNKFTVLILASFFGQKEIVQFLLDNGADIEAEAIGKTALLHAVNDSRKEIIEILLNNGADTEAKCSFGETALLKASTKGEKEIVQLLLNNEADIEARNESGESALILASREGKTEVVRLIIESGADIDDAIRFALNNENSQMLELLEEERQIKFENEWIKSENEAYLKEKQELEVWFEKYIQYLQKEDSSKLSSEDLLTALQIAIKKEEKGIVQLILNKGVDLETESSQGQTLLMMAYNQRNIEIITLLIDNGANIESKNNIQQTLLLIAVTNREEEIVSFLIDKGANIEAKDSYGKTSLMITCEQRDKELVSLLIDKGADIETRDKRGRTPLILACQRRDKEIVTLLLDRGANIESKIEHYLAFEVENPLLIALQTRNKEIVTLLLEKGASTDILISGKTLLEYTRTSISKSMFNLLNNFKNGHNPQKLVNILTNFTIDTPIKYTTHEWRNRIDAKYFNDFDLFLKDVSEQFKTLGSELKTLSPNLYQKVETFIVSTKNPNSWTSMKNLKPWVEDKKEPFDFPIANEHILFKTIIESFKNEIEIRGNMLQEIFLEHKKRLGRKFKITISDNLKGEKFYTDVETFKNAVDEIFREVEKYAKEQNEYEIEVELFKPQNDFIELHIIHSNSTSTREAEELLERIKQEKGDSVLKRYFKNLCDWEIKASCKNSHFRIDCFSEEIKSIEKPKGFTHIMRFYK